jgi:MtrB/PioB family decaheme-associated outer membrane protein
MQLAGLLVLALGATAALAEESTDAPPAVVHDNTTGFIEASGVWFVDEEFNDSAKFEEYRDVPSGVVLDHVLFDWFTEGNWYVNFEGDDLIEDDQRFELTAGKLDLWRFSLAWSENPRRFSDWGNQLWTHQGDGVFTLDDTLQAAIQAAPASVDADDDGVWDDGTKGAIIRDAILSSAPEIDLRYQRETGEAGLEFTPSPNWRFGFSGERERRNGNMPQSLGAYFFGSNSFSQVAAPIDYRTDTFVGWAEYRRERWNIGARYTISDFDTEYSALTWDNLLFLDDTAAGSDVEPGVNRMSLGTDNEYEQLVLYFGANLPGATRIHASIAEATAEQDDAFLPMSSNALLGVAPLAVTGLRGQHEYDHQSLRISSHPLPWLSLRGWYRSYEFDNNTPVYPFVNYAEVDRIVGPARQNLPYGYDTKRYGISPSFSPADWVSFGFSYENVQTDRSNGAVDSTDEDILRATVDFDLTDSLFLRASAATEDRRSQHFDAHYIETSFPNGESNEFAFNEGHREYFWADRDREVYDLMAEWIPMEKLGIHVSATYTDNSYSDPDTGIDIGRTVEVLQDRNGDGILDEVDILFAGRERDRQESVSIGLTWRALENLSFFGDYTWEREKWEMASRYRGISAGAGTDSSNDDWFSDVVDRYETATAGFDLDWAEGAWKLVGDLAYSWGSGNIYTTYALGGAPAGDTGLTAFPELETELWIATLELTREFAGGWTLGLAYWFESWQSKDWQTDFLRPYMGRPTQDPGSANSAFLGIDFADYENHLLMVTAKYDF